MIEYQPPHPYTLDGRLSIFLAGSIEMGVAEEWQSKAKEWLSKQDVVILNPRRDNWDSSWEQTIDNPKFKEQVNWELDAIEKCDLVLMYFDPKTQSPITLLELGMIVKSNPEKLIVCCPNGFWRKGNVDIVCERHGVEMFDSLEELIKRA